MNSEIKRELLRTAPVESMPGWETRLFLITYAADADGSGHSHPVPGLGYVLEGTMVTAFADDAEEIVLAGQSFQDKAGFHRVSRNSSATEPMRFVIALHGEDGRAQHHLAFEVIGEHGGFVLWGGGENRVYRYL